MTLALVASALVLTLVSGAEAAGAHESSTTTMPTTAPTTGLPAIPNASLHGASADVAGASPVQEPFDATEPEWPWIPFVVLGAGATWLILSSPQGAGRLRTTAPASGTSVSKGEGADAGSSGRMVHRRDVPLALALAVTGVVHFFETPTHWAEGWHLGLFFAASGAIVLGEAAAAVTKATRPVYASALATTLGLVVLYVLSRQVTLPLVDHRDPYLLRELPVKALELAAAALCWFRLAQRRRPSADVREGLRRSQPAGAGSVVVEVG